MDITSFIVIGAIVSVIVQIIKSKYGTNSTGTLVAVTGISLIAGTAYYFIKDTPYLQTVLSILGFAGAVYTYIIRRFE